MTAALLRSFGLRTPKEIKRRLHASVDYDEYLKNLVLWSGRLNIAKALSLYEDVLESALQRSVIREVGHFRRSVS